MLSQLLLPVIVQDALGIVEDLLLVLFAQGLASYLQELQENLLYLLLYRGYSEIEGTVREDFLEDCELPFLWGD